MPRVSRPPRPCPPSLAPDPPEPKAPTREARPPAQPPLALHRYLVRGGLSALVGRLASLLAAVAVGALVTRLLPPSGVGRFFLLFSVVTVAATVGQLGLPRTVVLRVSEARAAGDEVRARSVVRAVLILTLAGASATGLLLASGAGLAVVRLLGSDAGVLAMILLGVWSFARALEAMVGEIFRAYQQIGRAALMGSSLSGLVLIAILGIFLGMKSAGSWRPAVPHVLAGASAAATIAALVGLALLGRQMRGETGAADSTWRQLLSRSLPILGTTVVAMLWEALGLWILSAANRDQTELALLGSAARVSRLIGVPLVIANAVLMPVIAQLHARREIRRLNAVLRLSATVTALPALAAVLVLVTAGEPLLGMLFGSYYREGAPVLILLALGQGVSVWTGSSGVTLLMAGRQGLHLALNLLSLAALAIPGILWARTFGALGVALAILMAQSFQQLLFLVAARRQVGVWTCATADLRRLRRFWHASSEGVR